MFNSKKLVDRTFLNPLVLSTGVYLLSRHLSHYLRTKPRILFLRSVNIKFKVKHFIQFQEKEKKRYQAEQQRFELKHQRQLEELRAMSEATIKELEQLQNEKRKMLLEHETLKLKQRDEAFSVELKEWKSCLKPRKQVKFPF